MKSALFGCLKKETLPRSCSIFGHQLIKSAVDMDVAGNARRLYMTLVLRKLRNSSLTSGKLSRDVNKEEAVSPLTRCSFIS